MKRYRIGLSPLSGNRDGLDALFTRGYDINEMLRLRERMLGKDPDPKLIGILGEILRDSNISRASFQSIGLHPLFGLTPAVVSPLPPSGPGERDFLMLATGGDTYQPGDCSFYDDFSSVTPESFWNAPVGTVTFNGGSVTFGDPKGTTANYYNHYLESKDAYDGDLDIELYIKDFSEFTVDAGAGDEDYEAYIELVPSAGSPSPVRVFRGIYYPYQTSWNFVAGGTGVGSVEYPRTYAYIKLRLIRKNGIVSFMYYLNGWNTLGTATYNHEVKIRIGLEYKSHTQFSGTAEVDDICIVF